MRLLAHSIGPLRRRFHPSHERLRDPGRAPTLMSRRPLGVAVEKAISAVTMDPNTHAFVLATAFFTSIFFALAAWLPVALVLHHFLIR